MNFKTSTNYLKAVCILMMVIGIFWSLAGVFDPFGLYEHYFAQQFWNGETVPEDAETAFSFLMLPFGVLLIAYFVLQYCLLHYGFPTKQKWVWTTSVIGILVWFGLDSVLCLFSGYYFNVILANIPTILLMSPLFFMKNRFD